LILAGIFPLLILFILMRCYQQMIRDIFNVPEGAYKMMGRIVSGRRIRRIKLVVKDNLFAIEKVQILYDIIKEKQLESFTFVNKASPFNYNYNEFDTFNDNIAMLNNLPYAGFTAEWPDELQVCC